MKLVIPGGTGQVGTLLARSFHGAGHEVVVLSRRPEPTPGQSWRTVGWDAETLGDWTAELEGADAVVNLAGRNVNCRYTEANRQLILKSRVRSAWLVGEAISKASRPPRAWLQASTATIYAHRYDAPNDEATGLIGGSEPDAPKSWGFSIKVAKAWERTTLAAATPRTRKVLLRTSMVMSPDRGGIFDTLLRLVRFGLGGKVGDGRQFVSWIHDQDFVRAVLWLIERESVEGVVNVTSPNPLPYAEFMRALRKAWGMPIGLPATKWMVEIGALLMGSESELPLKSRRVAPGRLRQGGFSFQLPDWEEAAKDLCDRWKRLSDEPR